jgi:hypothetical protein
MMPAIEVEADGRQIRSAPARPEHDIVHPAALPAWDRQKHLSATRSPPFHYDERP